MKCLTAREGHVFAVFENLVLRRIFGPRRENKMRLEKITQ
jgi:hypothetical protein